MRQVLAADVLGAEKAIDFELVSLADEVELADADMPFETAGEVLRLAREWLSELIVAKASSYNCGLADVDVRMVLETLQAKVSLEEQDGTFFLCPIEDILQHVHHAELQRWCHIIGGLLRELEVLAAHVRFDEEPRALKIRAGLGARSATQPEVPSGLGYRVTCDGDYCWRSCRSDSQANADGDARAQGWLVSPEKDLCPEHWAKADPAAAAAAAAAAPRQPSVGLEEDPIPPAGPSLSPEEMIRLLAEMTQAQFEQGATPEAALLLLQEQFGDGAIGELWVVMPSDDEPFLKEPPFNGEAFLGLLALLRALAPVASASPPVPPEAT